MRSHRWIVVVATLGAWLIHAHPGRAQPRLLSETECQGLRQRLAEHAQLSDGVRRVVGAQAAAVPAPAVLPPRPMLGRADAIRARLDQIPRERQLLEDQRLAAMVRFDLGRAAQIQGQLGALEAERASLERELASLPAPTAPPGPQRPLSDTERIRCQELPGALEQAVRIRQRELGAREGQEGVVPLTVRAGQTAEQIGRELAAQFRPWPEAASQVGLLDEDGDGRLDGFADAAGPDAFRLYRERSDGTLSVEVFAPPGRGTAVPYGEIVRRLDETSARQLGRTLDDLLPGRPAGPTRVISETADFAQARAHFMAGNFAEAARLPGPAARASEFQNFRGETVRVLEIIAPATGSVGVRTVSVRPRGGNQELWEETATWVRPVSYWRAEVEVALTRQTRTGAGVPIGTRALTGPIRFTLEP